jgi:hypothetical protein
LESLHIASVTKKGFHRPKSNSSLNFLAFMTIVSHRYKFIFLKSRKTAGTSVEQWIALRLARGDWIATAEENCVPFRLAMGTPNATLFVRGLERSIKKRLPSPQFQMGEHMGANDVRKLVGNQKWNEYFKFSIERQPWDRLISLWKWREHRFRLNENFDAFLDIIERSPDDKMVRNWNNRYIYMIDGSIAADRIIRFENLSAEISDIAKRLGLPEPDVPLPSRKGSIRTKGNTVNSLTQEQIRRISRLCRQEIEMFGWKEPTLTDRSPASTD